MLPMSPISQVGGCQNNSYRVQECADNNYSIGQLVVHPQLLVCDQNSPRKLSSQVLSNDEASLSVNAKHDPPAQKE